MENGFSFELYDVIYKNCFIHSSRYKKNGNLQLSLFGNDPATNEISHFTDITLENHNKVLGEDEIVVDCKYKPTLITQLKELGVLKKQIGICLANSSIYPIYTINLIKVNEKCYCKQELIAA